VSGIILTVGHVVFATLFVMMLLRSGKRRGGATYFQQPQATEPEPTVVA
jgi:hypothetical protein